MSRDDTPSLFDVALYLVCSSRHSLDETLPYASMRMLDATGRLLRDDDRDLVLLAGDHLYALGLARLAALGDLPAVSELADVISLGAQAQAEGRADLAEAAWEAGAAARLMAGEVARVR